MFGITVDKDSLEQLIKDFNTLTGIRVAFLTAEQREIVGYQKDISEFCSLLRKDPCADAKCKECDKNAFKRAKEKQGLYLYQCHAGLTEAIAPISVNSETVGYMMFGQALGSAPSKALWEKILNNCSGYSIDYTALENAFYKMPGMEKEKLLAAANIMEMSTKYIHFTRVVSLKLPSTLEKIDKYINENIHNPISITDISKYLSLSKSYLSRLIKDNFKMSLSDYVLKTRIEKAQQLLAESEESIKDVAFALGFEDPNYFSRVFKRIAGISPSQYRKR